MKILSWNINGIRASKVNLKTLFDSLHADVICLQETKVTRDMLDESTAIVEGYNSYFSFSKKKSGYSGVANFCKDSVTPFKAEQGLSGVLTLKEDGSVGCYGNLTPFTDDELQSLDAEGRAVITQHRIKMEGGIEEDLAIINVYCPRADPEREDRHLYKLRFFALLQTRAEALLKAGSHVIVLGDINTVHKLIDHCDPNHEEFVKKPSRVWLNQFLREEDRDSTLEPISEQEVFAGVTPYTTGGLFIDTFRYVHPEQEGAYTNWCTLTGARATNYGRRLDYIFGNIDLVEKCLTGATIMPHIEGSDHCPVTVELNCEMVSSKSCPPLCTKYMPEFAGKQKKLSMFFTKIKKDESLSKKEQIIALSETGVSKAGEIKAVSKESDLKTEITASSSQSGMKRSLENRSLKNSGPLKKRKTDSKKPDLGSKQSSLKTFFTVDSKESVAEKKVTSVSIESSPEKPQHTVNTSYSLYFNKHVQKDFENGSQEDEESNSKSAHVPDNTKNTQPEKTVTNSKTVNAWKNLLGGLGPAPLCKGHNEPCVLRMVKKEGPNKGKQFYTCARGEGLKSNPEARCDFFKWVDKKKS